MNILDFHTHAYPDKIADRLTARMQAATPGAKRYGDGTVTMLQQRNAARGITHCVQLNIAATGNSVTRMNDFAISVRDRQGIIPFGTLHPDQSLQQMHDELQRLQDHGIRGVKLQPVSQGFFINEPRAMTMWEQLAKWDMVVCIHCGADPADKGIAHASPWMTAQMLDAFPSLKAVLAHMGGMDEWDQAEALIWGRDVYIDIAMTEARLHGDVLARMLAKHPHDKILYGSDYPWHDGEELAYLAELPAALRSQILWSNGARLLGLEETGV